MGKGLEDGSVIRNEAVSDVKDLADMWVFIIVRIAFFSL